MKLLHGVGRRRSFARSTITKYEQLQTQTKADLLTKAYGQFFARGGGEPLAQKFTQVVQIFTKQSKRNKGHMMR